MMTLSMLIKATAILGLGMSVAMLARRARASTRHVILSCTFAALVALPIAAAWIPPVAIAVPASAGLTRSGAAGNTPVDGAGVARLTAFDRALLASGYKEHTPIVEMARRIWRDAGLSTLWVGGGAALLVWLAAGLARLRRVRREAVPALAAGERARALCASAGIRTRVEVLQHEAVAAPLTYGVWRPAIILPQDADAWSAGEMERALTHELEHVRRGDWLVQIFARLVCTAFWFHPLAWMALRRLCLEAERACDDAVVRSGAETDYAEQLVGLARRLSAAAAPLSLGMARRSDLSTRVSALLDVRQRRGPAAAGSIAAIATAATLFVLALAPVTAVAVAGGQQPLLPKELHAYGDQRERASSADRALYRAAFRGDLERMLQLIDGGANVNAVIEGDGSPLIGAARTGRVEAVKLLLARGADPNLAVEGDGNPLIMAAREGRIDVVALLLDRGAQINMVVPSDENALIQASEKGQLEVVKLLVARGADVNARVYAEFGDQRGGEWRTPLSQARRAGRAEVVAYLQSVGAR